jgi:hypothetical protein
MTQDIFIKIDGIDGESQDAAHVNEIDVIGWYRDDGLIDDLTFIDGVQRDHFRLHPVGRNGQSDGCITLPSREQFDALRAYLKAQPPAFIPGTVTWYYGTVEVQ